MSIFEYCLAVCLYVSCCLNDSSGISIPREPLMATKISVDTSFSEYNVSRGFISVGFPHYMYKWDMFNLSSPKAINLASALKHTSLRLYGTPLLNEADIAQYSKDKELWRFNDYDQNWAVEVFHDPEKLILTMEHWTRAVEFLNKVGWKLMMDFTALIHYKGRWVSRYAETLLEWATKNKMQIPEIQLGNEPNLYDPLLKINASTVVRDFMDLRELLRKKFPSYSASKIIGPDVTKFPTKSNKKNKFFEKFLRAGGCDHVDEISFHHYYFKTDSTESDFIDYKTLDSYKSVLLSGKNLMTKYNCQKPLRLTETASSVGGGTEGLSNSFIAGFSWMDKLGMSALHGITRVFRHTFFGSFYALVNNDLTPNPDYYLSLVFSKFVEGPVFRIRNKIPNHIRAYANCANEYTPGSLVIYLMNLKDRYAYLNFTKYSSHVLSVYLFTAFKDRLRAKKTILNNEQLSLKANRLPILKEARYAGDAVTIPPLSYAFVVITRADIPACKNYFREQRLSETTTKETTTSTTTGSTRTTRTTPILEVPTAPTESVSTSSKEDYDTDRSLTMTEVVTSGPEIKTFTAPPKTSAGETMASTYNAIIKYNVSTATHKNTKEGDTTPDVIFSSFATERLSEASFTGTIYTNRRSSAVQTTSPVIFPTILNNLPDDKETVTPINLSAVRKPPSTECVMRVFAFLLLCWIF